MKKIIIIIMLLISMPSLSFAQSCENLANSLDYLRSEIILVEEKSLKDIYVNTFKKYYEIFIDKCIVSAED